jgi:hypothetical protein
MATAKAMSSAVLWKSGLSQALNLLEIFAISRNCFFYGHRGGGSPPEFYWIKLHKAAVKKTFTRFTPLKSNLQNTYCNIKKLLLLQVTGKLFRKKQYHIASRREKEEQS